MGKGLFQVPSDRIDFWVPNQVFGEITVKSGPRKGFSGLTHLGGKSEPGMHEGSALVHARFSL
jgi:hypothetical protein